MAAIASFTFTPWSIGEINFIASGLETPGIGSVVLAGLNGPSPSFFGDLDQYNDGDGFVQINGFTISVPTPGTGALAAVNVVSALRRWRSLGRSRPTTGYITTSHSFRSTSQRN